MNNKVITAGVAVLLALVAMSFILKSSDKEKAAFIYNDKLFNAFKGTIELENKLKDLEDQHRRTLDSLMALPLSEGNMKTVQEERVRVETILQEVSAKYTDDIWKQINESVSKYGEENGYDFIFGASGDGSLMYARPTMI